MIKNFFKINNIEYIENAQLKKHNTFHIAATCKYLVFPQNENELINIIKETKRDNIKYIILGNGSNVILDFDHYEGIIIKLDNLNAIEYDGNVVTVGAGYSLIKLAIETINKGLSGLTFAAGIPGCVGASTAMNAGAYNSDMASVVKNVKILNANLEIEILTKDQLNYSYRDSFLKQHPENIVLATTLELSPGNILEMNKQVKERRNKRPETQPLDMPSAGSVFRNPEGMYAGELIEKLGLKGYNINGAEISPKHANFIVNKGNAHGKDIIELINKVKKEVKEKYNVDLKLEQIIIK